MQCFYAAIHAMVTPTIVCPETKDLYGYALPVLNTQRLLEMLQKEFGCRLAAELLQEAVRIHEDKLERRGQGGF